MPARARTGPLGIPKVHYEFNDTPGDGALLLSFARMRRKFVVCIHGTAPLLDVVASEHVNHDSTDYSG